MENPNYKKLIGVLEEVFQLNQADLDFGIYRIMNHKRTEILQFLHKDLIPQIKEILAENLSGDKSAIQKDLDKAIQQAKELGADPENLPKVKTLRQQLAGATDIEAEENAVFAYLANFFKRYYDGGDFISLRRYKEGVYAIPYEGEEVKLHWANHDQYYIKTSEFLKNYAFKLGNEKTVRFVLAVASTEQNNNKSSDNQERRFALFEKKPIEVIGNELHIFFTYELADKKVKQGLLMNIAFDTLKTQIPEAFQEVLISNATTVTEKNKNRTLLEKHLKDYVARYTFDYFIHKNLAQFLRQELDFFIKNEVLHLDDINTRDTNDFVRQLSQVRALKTIALKIIAFLGQLENFQKKLWLKKKFVVETQYCITLDRIPEKLYSIIVENKQQVQEWKDLFLIQEITDEKDIIKGELFENEVSEQIAYSEPLSINFLKTNPFLVLDTRFFDEDFKDELIASIDNLDASLNGILINSENFQALNLIQQRYKEQIDCNYIDPPYNTDSSEIAYKNGYKSSSWITLINNGLPLAKILLRNHGILCATIDDEQQKELTAILTDTFGKENYLGTVCIRINPSGRIKLRGFAQSHEYAIFMGKSIDSSISRFPRSAEQFERFNKEDKKGRFEQRNFRREGSSSEKISRPRRFFPFYILENKIRIPKLEWIDSIKEYKILEEPSENEKVLFPIDSRGGERVWRWGLDRIAKETSEIYPKINNNGELQLYYKYRPNQEGVLPTTIWTDKKYSATEYGTAILKKYFGGRNEFSFPKSIHAVEDCLKISSHQNNKSTIILDYFAGSGTTAHATINLNREDGGNRKYILIEMGKYFDSATKPRVQKVIYSKDWKDGKPVSREGSSHCFKCIRLESYEDALNNLTLDRKEAQSLALQENANFREGYMLNYMLDTETQGSLLNIAAFEDPFNYHLNITRDNEMKATKVDMVETFNYLIGLVVESMKTIRGFRVVEGHNLKEERILVIWRNTKEKSNDDLNAFFQKMSYSTRDQEFDRIYVNGDNNLENLRTEEDKWKVVMLEEEFKKRMFDVADV